MPAFAAARSAPAASWRRRLIWGAVGGVLILAGVAYLARAWRRPAAKPPAKLASGRVMLAVLPFVNLSGDPSQDYFADGLTEEMITDLGRLNPRRLGVIARTSAMQYKQTHEDVRQIGRELGVGYILEGSVRREGNKARISAQLIRVSDQTHVWARNYQRQVKDILSVQQDVAQAIAERIQINLSRGQRRQLSEARPASPEAYDDYLKGLYFWNRRSIRALAESVKYFNQAIREDPDYALAYAGLAQCYALMSMDAGPVPVEVKSKAEAEALKATQLDPSSAEAHTALAGIRVISEYDWAGAEAEFKRALDLNPNYSLAHHWYASLCLDPQGQFGEAIVEMKRAQDLDPLSLIINTDLGYTYYLAGQSDNAFQQYQRVLELDPRFVPVHWDLAMFYAQKRMYDAWLHEATRDIVLSGRPELAKKIEQLYASGGYRRVQEAAAATQGKYLNGTGGSRPAASSSAAAYAALGEKDRALTALELAYQDREPSLIFLKVDPAWSSLRSDLRFQNLERRMGLLADSPGSSQP